VTRLEFRGPFLLVFALDQQLGSLLARAMADAPLRPEEFAVYSSLRLMQPTTPSELANVLGLRLTTMSSHLVKMSERGHLERSRNPRDGRSAIIALTPEGLRATEGCFASFQAAIAAFQRHYPGSQTELLEVLEQVSTALAAASEELADGQQSPGPP
jgi:DNA-binding MarR family transcriptional regulator